MQLTILLAETLLLVHSVFMLKVSEEHKAFKQATFEKCRKETGVSESAAQKVYDQWIAEPVKDKKCFLRCIHREYKVIKEDETVDMEKVEEAAKKEFPDPKKYEKLTPVLRECMAKVNRGSDPCERSYEVVDCYFINAQKVFPGQ